MHYSFHKDLVDGEAYQNYLINRFNSLGIPSRTNPFTDYESMKSFDIFLGKALCEVKLDIMARKTGNLCFETDLLYTPSSLIIYGIPTYRDIFSHVFTRADVWRFALNYPTKFVGDHKRTESIIVPIFEAKKWGYPLTTLEQELYEQIHTSSSTTTKRISQAQLG